MPVPEQHENCRGHLHHPIQHHAGSEAARDVSPRPGRDAPELQAGSCAYASTDGLAQAGGDARTAPYGCAEAGGNAVADSDGCAQAGDRTVTGAHSEARGRAAAKAGDATAAA